MIVRKIENNVIYHNRVIRVKLIREKSIEKCRGNET